MLNRSAKNNLNLWPSLLLILSVVLAGELICRGWDMYDGWKKYQRLLSEMVSYRDQTYSLSKPVGVTRVLLLGGSAVHDTVKDYRQSWPYFLEQKLRERTGKKVEIINMGFWTEGSTDELFKLSEFGMDLHPDLVIVFDGENDVYNLFHHYDYWKRLYEIKAKIILHEKKHKFITRFFGNIRKNSALYRRINQLKKDISTQLSFQAMKHPGPASLSAAGNSPAQEAVSNQPKKDLMAGVGPGPQGDQFFEDQARWPEIRTTYLEIYASNLEKMAKLIGRLHAQGLFIFQPDLSYKQLLTDSVTEAERTEYLKLAGKHEALWKEIQKQTYPEGIRIMRETASQYGLSFYDFNQRLLLTGDVHQLFDGNVHFSGEGRKKIADEISAIILKQKLI